MSAKQELTKYESTQSDSDDEEQLFAAVLATIDIQQLPRLAGAVRRRVDGCKTDPVVGNAIYGSYHILFPLDFNDGVRWLVKIPVNGTPRSWDTLSANALTSEAKTMQLIKHETKIPLPDVFDFSSTTQNNLRCPYILMSFIRGVSLYDVWFGNKGGPDLRHNHRIRALEGIAAAMLQLEKFSFQKGGAIMFGQNRKIDGIGSTREVDQQAMLDRWFIHKDPDDEPLYVQVGPFSDTKEYYTCMLDLHPESKPFVKGMAILLRKLISWIPEPKEKAGFVLTHPDFDIQNVIVSEEGELQGLIDWDGVAALPRSLGNERYPGWLTRDWDPAMYGYIKSMDEGVKPEGVWEDSPEQLAYYRGVYKNIMKKRPERTASPNAALTHISLFADNLAIAARDPGCRKGILEKIVYEISIVVGATGKLDLFDIATRLSEGVADEGAIQILKTGFEALLQKDGL